MNEKLVHLFRCAGFDSRNGGLPKDTGTARRFVAIFMNRIATQATPEHDNVSILANVVRAQAALVNCDKLVGEPINRT